MEAKRLVINSKYESILSTVDDGFNKYNTSATFRTSIDSVLYGGESPYNVISRLCDIIDNNNILEEYLKNK